MAPSESFFEPLVAGDQKASLVKSFSVALPIQALRVLTCLWSFSAVLHLRHIEGPLAGVLLCRSACQALQGAPWVGSYSVVPRVRHLIGQPLYFSATDTGLWGERICGDGSTLYM